MTKTRRELLKGTIATAAVATMPLPSFAIPGLASITTLEQLAAEGKFASSPLYLPEDVHSDDWKFWLNGKLFKGFIKEIYAPGDSTGWAVVWPREDKNRYLETELIRGNWTMKRVPATE